jgi:hypothetical protein
MHDGVVFSNKEWNYVVCGKMYGTRDHYAKENKPDSKRKVAMYSLICVI